MIISQIYPTSTTRANGRWPMSIGNRSKPVRSAAAALTRFGHVAPATYRNNHCSEIHWISFSRTSGAKVSSMSLYSLGEPVWQCWNKWFTPSIASKLFLVLSERPLRSAPRLLSGSTCVSFVPFSARTGQVTSPSSGRTSKARKYFR